MSFRLLLGALPPLILLLIYGAAIDHKADAISYGNAIPTQNAYSYGTGNGLATWQYDVLQNLSFPQSYAAVIDRVGYPDARSDDGLIDYYQLPAGGWVAIEYDTNNSAIGYRAEFGG